MAGEAVRTLDLERLGKLGQLETANQFQAIFVAPEYMFTDPAAPGNRRGMDEATKDALLSEFAKISNTYKEILIFPGTVFWRQSLNNLQNILRFQAQLVAAEMSNRTIGRIPGSNLLKPSELRLSDVVDQPRFLGQKYVPSLQTLSKVEQSNTSSRVYNELYPFLGGKQYTPYLKQWDFKETEGARAKSQAFVPGSSSGRRHIGGFDFGLEICFDHANGALRAKRQEVDFHIVCSDCVDTKIINMAMKKGGYFIHASSNPADTCAYKKSGIVAEWLEPTPDPIQSNDLNWWLVDVERRAGA